jgi:hypothetical protein
MAKLAGPPNFLPTARFEYEIFPPTGGPPFVRWDCVVNPVRIAVENITGAVGHTQLRLVATAWRLGF